MIDFNPDCVADVDDEVRELRKKLFVRLVTSPHCESERAAWDQAVSVARTFFYLEWDLRKKGLAEKERIK